MVVQGEIKNSWFQKLDLLLGYQKVIFKGTFQTTQSTTGLATAVTEVNIVPCIY